MIAQGQRRGPDDEVVQGRHPRRGTGSGTGAPQAGPLPFELGTQGDQIGDVGFVTVGELRHLLQAGAHGAGDRAAHPGQRHDLAWPGSGRRPARGRRR